MLGKSRTAVIGVIAVAIVAALAVPAFGAVVLTLTASPSTGRYGTEVSLTPSVDTTVTPGGKFQLQVLEDDEWVDYTEAQSVEETGEVLPISLLLNGELTYPAKLRAVYVGKDASATSEPVTLGIVKNTRTTLAITAPKVVARNRSFAVSAQVLPDSGVGTIRVDRARVGVNSGIPADYTITTDDQGFATTTMRFTQKGTYVVSMRFVGNQFGASSAVAKKTIVVK